MNYYFHPEALQEYTEAAEYYSDISHTLAIAFISQVENGINQILLYPQAWQPIENVITNELQPFCSSFPRRRRE